MSNEGSEQTLTRLSVMFLQLLHEESGKTRAYSNSVSGSAKGIFLWKRQRIISEWHLNHLNEYDMKTKKELRNSDFFIPCMAKYTEFRLDLKKWTMYFLLQLVS